VCGIGTALGHTRPLHTLRGPVRQSDDDPVPGAIRYRVWLAWHLLRIQMRQIRPVRPITAQVDHASLCPPGSAVRGRVPPGALAGLVSRAAALRCAPWLPGGGSGLLWAPCTCSQATLLDPRAEQSTICNLLLLPHRLQPAGGPRTAAGGLLRGPASRGQRRRPVVWCLLCPGLHFPGLSSSLATSSLPLALLDGPRHWRVDAALLVCEPAPRIHLPGDPPDRPHRGRGSETRPRPSCDRKTHRRCASNSEVDHDRPG
jgi:hypothetical protein